MICPNLSQGSSPNLKGSTIIFFFFFAISFKHKHPRAVNNDISDHKLGDTRFSIVVQYSAHWWQRAPSTDQGHPSCRGMDLRNHFQEQSYSLAEWQVKIHAAWGQIAKPSALWLKITSQQCNFIYCKLFLSFPLQDLLHLILELPAIR